MAEVLFVRFARPVFLRHPQPVPHPDSWTVSFSGPTNVDIRFKRKQVTSPILTFEDVHVENSLPYEVVLKVTFKRALPFCYFHVRLARGGAYLQGLRERVDRPWCWSADKHDLPLESDPRNNLPCAVARPELSQLNVREILEMLMQAKGSVIALLFNALMIYLGLHFLSSTRMRHLAPLRAKAENKRAESRL